MYFSPDAMRTVVHKLSEALVPGGYLFLGPVETLRGVTEGFRLCHTHDTFYYQKRCDAASTCGVAAVDQRPRAATIALQQRAATAASTDLYEIGETCASAVGLSAERIAKLCIGVDPLAASHSEPHHSDGAPLVALRAAETPAPVDGASPCGCSPRLARRLADSAIVASARLLVSEEKFDDALELLRMIPESASRTADTELLRAVVCTHCGQLQEAEQICKRVLDGDQLNAEAHYLVALLREQAGQVDEAIEEDQRAVYSDGSFAMPQVHLGLLAKRRGDRSLAATAFRQACELLPFEAPSRLALFSGGFSRQALVQLCSVELRCCGES
jgi:chemotaxis protein methyltransferase CheR